MKIFAGFLLLFSLMMVSCGVSSKDLAEKITNNEELSQGDYEAMFKYFEKILDDEKLGSSDTTFVSEKYPELMVLAANAGESNDAAVAKNIDNLIATAKEKGKMKEYYGNPVYIVLSYRPVGNSFSKQQMEAVKQYINAGLNSGLSGAQLNRSFPNLQTIVTDWSSSNDEAKKQVVRDAMK